MDIPTPGTTAFDDDGFLLDPENWSETLARNIAQADGIGPLGAAHLAVIHTLRQQHGHCGGIPCLRHVCRLNDLNDHCVTELFTPASHPPEDHSARELWRISGLPNPGEEVRSYW